MIRASAIGGDLRLMSSQRSRERGGALLELAIVIPFMLILVVGTVDFGRIFYKSMAVAQAARAGAEYGAQSMTTVDDTTAIKNAAKNAVASDFPLLSSDLTIAKNCECATDAGVFSPTSPANTCDGSGCISTQHTVVTVSVQATKTFSTIVSYPRIPNSVTITRTTKIRVQ
jgi:Flp pilus assembly protein TadG